MKNMCGCLKISLGFQLKRFHQINIYIHNFKSQAQGQTTCIKCPAGSTCDANGETACSLPEYSPEGVNECLSCPAGHEVIHFQRFFFSKNMKLNIKL